MENTIRNYHKFDEENWHQFKKLYWLIKGAVQYAETIRGNHAFQFDIEILMSVLNELEKKERNIIYPFIGSWNKRLVEIAGYDFKIIEKL